MRKNYEGDEAGRCGGCGSRDVLTLQGDPGGLGKCMACGRFQHVETRDWPESELCDDCAYRKGSPERDDPEEWAKLKRIAQDGTAFHCHKGLAFDPATGDYAPPDPATGRATICAGWLRANIAHHRRRERQS